MCVPVNAEDRLQAVNQALDHYETPAPDTVYAGAPPQGLKPDTAFRVPDVSRFCALGQQNCLQRAGTAPVLTALDFQNNPLFEIGLPAANREQKKEDDPKVVDLSVSSENIPETDRSSFAAPAGQEGRIDVLQLKNVDIMDVLKLVAEKSGMNIIAGKGVIGKVTIYLKDVNWRDALRVILDSNGLAYTEADGIVQILNAAEFEQRYGYKFGGEIETRIFRLNYVEAQDMVTLLSQIKTYLGKIVFDAASRTLVISDDPETLGRMADLIAQIDVQVDSDVFKLSYAQAEDLSAKVSEVLTPSIGRVKFDKRSNTLVVRDTPAKMEEIRKIIRSFDQPEPQVLIEAKILQVILSDQEKFGVDWEGIVRAYHGLDFKSTFDVLKSTDKGGSVTIGTLATDDYTAMLEALKTEGKTNILSSPSITTLNNEEAKILVGSTEPYVTTTTTTPASGPTTTAESVNFIEVGVKLYVTPMIHEDDFITLKVRPEVSSVTRSVTTSNNNTIPVVETSEAETMVTVKDGVTLVIGGLIKEELINTDNKVPVLGDIPLLGAAFRNKDHLKRKTEIVIFLTPRIITGDVPTGRIEEIPKF